MRTVLNDTEWYRYLIYQRATGAKRGQRHANKMQARCLSGPYGYTCTFISVLAVACLLTARAWYTSLRPVQLADSDAIQNEPKEITVVAPNHPDTATKIILTDDGEATKPSPIMARINNLDRPAYLFVPCIGRFGNNLFQYASTYSIALDTNRTAVLHPRCQKTISEIMPYISAPVKSLPPNISISVLMEKAAGKYQPSLLQKTDNDSKLCCYLQSWKYFYKHSERIHEQFLIGEVHRKQAQKTLRTLIDQHKAHNARVNRTDKSHANTSKDTAHLTVVGVHVRRGDFASETSNSKGYWPAPRSYFLKAMDYFRAHYNNTLFVVCSDHLDWARDNLKHASSGRLVDDVQFVGTKTVTDFALLVSCDHMIISVGSYGWWAGWLNGGTVVYYKGWPQAGSQVGDLYDLEDYYLPAWVGVGS